MKDLNYFAAPATKKEKNKIQSLLLVFIAVIICLVALVYIYVQINAATTQSSIDQAKAYISAADVVSQYADVTKIKQQKQYLTKYEVTFDNIDGYLVAKFPFNSDLIKNITAQLPQKVFFNTISMTGISIMIDATASDFQSIAEFQHNLESTKLFSWVKLMSIARDQIDMNKIVFSIVITLKDVMTE